MLVDNYREANAFLHVADGIEAMHRQGPTKGETLPLGSLLVGDDGIEVDWHICKKIGLDPLSTLQFQVLGAQRYEVPMGDPLLENRNFIHAPKLAVSFNPFRLFLSVLKQALHLL